MPSPRLRPESESCGTTTSSNLPRALRVGIRIGGAGGVGVLACGVHFELTDRFIAAFTMQRRQRIPTMSCSKSCRLGRHLRLQFWSRLLPTVTRARHR